MARLDRVAWSVLVLAGCHGGHTSVTILVRLTTLGVNQARCPNRHAHQSTHRGVGDAVGQTEAAASLALARYDRGATVWVFYNPADPNDSLLEHVAPSSCRDILPRRTRPNSSCLPGAPWRPPADNRPPDRHTPAFTRSPS